MAMVEWEIVYGRRAFPVTQQAFAGADVAAPRLITTGWHDTGVHPESGAFAVVRSGAGLDDLIGEVVRVTLGGLRVFVFVMQDADVPTDLSLARRAFLAIGLLSAESVSCEVAPVDPVMAVDVGLVADGGTAGTLVFAGTLDGGVA